MYQAYRFHNSDISPLTFWQLQDRCTCFEERGLYGAIFLGLPFLDLPAPDPDKKLCDLWSCFVV